MGSLKYPFYFQKSPKEKISNWGKKSGRSPVVKFPGKKRGFFEKSPLKKTRKEKVFFSLYPFFKGNPTLQERKFFGKGFFDFLKNFFQTKEKNWKGWNLALSSVGEHGFFLGERPPPPPFQKRK